MEGFLEFLVNIFKVFCFLSQKKKKLETWKRFVTSDREALFAIIDAPSQYRSVVFTHNPAFLALSEFKMAGVDLKTKPKP